MKWMKSTYVAVLLALVVASPGCASLGTATPASVVTPAGQTAWTADQVVQQLGRFQNAVIDGVGAGKVKLADGRALVTWISGDVTTTPPTIGLLTTIANNPGSWQPPAQVTWTTLLRPRLAGNATLASWLPIIDSFFP